MSISSKWDKKIKANKELIKNAKRNIQGFEKEIHTWSIQNECWAEFSKEESKAVRNTVTFKGIQDDSQPGRARMILQQNNRVMNTEELLEAMGEEITKDKKINLRSVLTGYAKKGDTFIRIRTGVFALKSFVESDQTLFKHETNGAKVLDPI